MKTWRDVLTVAVFVVLALLPIALVQDHLKHRPFDILSGVTLLLLLFWVARRCS